MGWRCSKGWAADGRSLLLGVRRHALGPLLLGDDGRGLRGGLKALPLPPQAISGAGRRLLLRGVREGKEYLKREAGQSLPFGPSPSTSDLILPSSPTLVNDSTTVSDDLNG